MRLNSGSPLTSPVASNLTKKLFGCCSGLLIFLGCLCLSARADIIVGAPATANDGNCAPFGCAYSGEYQQAYSSSAFSGTITITGLQFFDTSTYVGATTAMNSGIWTIDLDTTTANPLSLSSTFSSNVTGTETEVFSGNLAQPWAFGDTLTINFTTPYTYDPTDGNLLLDVFASGVSDPGGAIFFDASSSSPEMGRVFCFSANCSSFPSAAESDFGLVTNFLTAVAPSPVPEPESFLLLSSGLATMVAALRGKLARR